MTSVKMETSEMLITNTTDIVASYVSNNCVAIDELSPLIQEVFATLSGLASTAEPAEEKPEPAVSVRSSVTRDHIVCLEEGRKVKMLKPHLKRDHRMTPDEYRARWSLPSDYPMVAPDYAAMRRDLAKKIGLGRAPGQKRGQRKKAL